MLNRKPTILYTKKSRFPLKLLYLAIGASLVGAAAALAASKALEEKPVPAQSLGKSLTTQLISLLESSPTTKGFFSRLCGAQETQLTSSTDLPHLEGLIPPETGLKEISQLGAQTLVYANASPFPTINGRARLAEVPVMMYHDVLPETQVFFDITPDKLRHDFQLIREHNLTPISLEQLVTHLKTGAPLPEKPILLTFDDGYLGHYKYVYPLLKEYGYPAVFSIYPSKPNGEIVGRSTVTWEQLREMAADPLVTIASHSVTHPPDLTVLSDAQLQQEVVESKRVLEEKLGIPIRYFTYPEGHYDERVTHLVEEAGYEAAITMNDQDERFAGQSESLLAIARFGQSRLEDVMDQAWGGPPLPNWGAGFDFNAPVKQGEATFDDVPLLLISGGRPTTIHADSRYQLPEILAGTEAVAAVDGGFFSLKYLDSNVMIGPVLSQNPGEFVPGNEGENPKLDGRPLVLISPDEVKFIPFDHTRHNTLEGIQAESPHVTDAFVAAATLVKQGEPQAAETFGDLYGADVARHRAFWGINTAGQPVIGVSTEAVDAASLSVILAKAGFWNAVMLDSGASTSLAYQGESLVSYTPRPVPHAVALLPSQQVASCILTSQQRADQ